MKNRRASDFIRRNRLVIILACIPILLISISAGAVLYTFKSGYLYRMVNQTRVNSEGNFSTEEKLEDFDYMYNLLKDNYPYFEIKKRMTGYDWLSHKEEFENIIANTKNDYEFFNEMNTIILKLQNGHTNIFGPYAYNLFAKDSISGNPWGDVLHDPYVEGAYEYWETVVGDAYFCIPMDFKYIEGSYIVYEGKYKQLSKYGVPEGSKLVNINKLNIDDYVNSLSDGQTLEYDYKRKKYKVDDLEILSKQQGTSDLVFIGPDNREIKVAVNNTPYNPEIQDTIFGDSSERNFFTQKYEDKSIAYIKIKAMNKNTQYTDNIEIKKFLESIKDYKALIVDIRDNGGGYESYWTYNLVEPLTEKNLSVDYITAFRDSEYTKPFMESSLILDFKFKPVSELPKNSSYPAELGKDFAKFVMDNKTVGPEYPVGFKGKIYLLVNGGTFSAAESFASFSKATKWATIVGTPTGGDGVGQGPIYASLPNTSLVIRFPYTMGLNPDGTANEETHTQPEIYCEQSYADFMKYVKWSREHSSKTQVNPYDTVVNSILKK